MHRKLFLLFCITVVILKNEKVIGSLYSVGFTASSVHEWVWGCRFDHVVEQTVFLSYCRRVVAVQIVALPLSVLTHSAQLKCSHIQISCSLAERAKIIRCVNLLVKWRVFDQKEALCFTLFTTLLAATNSACGLHIMNHVCSHCDSQDPPLWHGHH